MEFAKSIVDKLQIELGDVFAYIIPGAIMYLAFYQISSMCAVGPNLIVKLSPNDSFVNLLIVLLYLTIFRFLGVMSSSLFAIFKWCFRWLGKNVDRETNLEKQILREVCRDLSSEASLGREKKIVFLALRSHIQNVSPHSAMRSYKQAALRQLRRNSIPAIVILAGACFIKYDPSWWCFTFGGIGVLLLVVILNYTSQKSRDREMLEIYSAYLAKKLDK